jgi:hypothetical protein
MHCNVLIMETLQTIVKALAMGWQYSENLEQNPHAHKAHKALCEYLTKTLGDNATVLGILKRKPNSHDCKEMCLEDLAKRGIADDTTVRVLANQVLQAFPNSAFSPSESSANQPVNTSGGTAIYGSVEVKGDFVGRDQITIKTRAPALSRELALELHLTYLRSWFGQKWATVSLADYSDSKLEPVCLTDIYVPLRVDFSITIKLERGRVVDWYRNDADEIHAKSERTPSGELAGLLSKEEKSARKSWASLKVDEAQLQRIVDHYLAKNHYSESDTKESVV